MRREQPLERFVRATALEVPRGIRVDVVSPPLVSETLEAMGQDGSKGLPTVDVTTACAESLESQSSGEGFDPRSLVKK